MKIKICGLFREQDIEFANEAKPDFIGFVFAEKSKRFVNARQAEDLRKNLSKKITAIGVFANAKTDFICELHQNKTIEIAQLHGSESDDYIRELKSKCSIPIIRAAMASETADCREAFQCALAAGDYFLLDSHTPGSGKAFNWEHLRNIDLSKNIFLAGGINLENIKEAMMLNPYAIDISSGAETDGIKDREKILKLVEAARCFCKQKKN
ncbi:MAG: phosphoribosylanthranilate isomerase [Fibromonadales bacterium]|nr:phosphoribosylanthranilate isomerase [Fibromonadales bacterium]